MRSEEPSLFFYSYGSLPAHYYADEQGFGDSVGP